MLVIDQARQRRDVPRFERHDVVGLDQTLSLALSNRSVAAFVRRAANPAVSIRDERDGQCPCPRVARMGAGGGDTAQIARFE